MLVHFLHDYGSWAPARVCQDYEIKRTKCVRWMPRRLQAMKDVAVCDKLRGAGNRL